MGMVNAVHRPAVRASHLPEAVMNICGRAARVNEGRGFLFVSHTGEIYPSGFLPISAGNVRNDSLIDVYRNSALFRDLRDTSKLKGKCGDWEFKEVCSGSRARAYAMTGDYLAEEPFCSYIPGRTLAARSASELEAPWKPTTLGSLAANQVHTAVKCGDSERVAEGGLRG